DLEDTLAQQRRQVVTDGAAAPVGDAAGEAITQSECGLRLGQPRQPAIGGESSAVKGHHQRHASGRRKHEGRRARLGHRSTSQVGGSAAPILWLMLRSVYLWTSYE